MFLESPAEIRIRGKLASMPVVHTVDKAPLVHCRLALGLPAGGRPGLAPIQLALVATRWQSAHALAGLPAGSRVGVVGRLCRHPRTGRPYLHADWLLPMTPRALR